MSCHVISPQRKLGLSESKIKKIRRKIRLEKNKKKTDDQNGDNNDQDAGGPDTSNNNNSNNPNSDSNDGDGSEDGAPQQQESVSGQVDIQQQPQQSIMASSSSDVGREQIYNRQAGPPPTVLNFNNLTVMQNQFFGDYGSSLVYPSSFQLGPGENSGQMHIQTQMKNPNVNRMQNPNANQMHYPNSNENQKPNFLPHFNDLENFVGFSILDTVPQSWIGRDHS